MADPILHIKDSYYFEIPKALWRHNYTSLDQVPEFLSKAHPNATVEEFNRELDGKILIPQPFATLKNLYEKESGLAISRFMIIELVIALLMAAAFIGLARKLQGGGPPRGKLWNMLEGSLLFVRDQIARPAIGGHDADKFLPILWTLFFFVLLGNLLGLVPYVGSITGAWAVTLTLAGITFLTVLIGGTRKFGVAGFWLNQVPHMDLPVLLRPIKIAIFFLEVLGLLIKHAVLSIRLLANMVAGHIVLLAILGLIVSAAEASTAVWGSVTAISVIGSVLLSCLELFVALLQAYVFTFLSALFIGAAVHHH